MDQTRVVRDPEATDAPGDGRGSGNGAGDQETAGGDQEPAVQAVLAAVQDSALQLLAGFPRPPATLRIQAGDVTVEAAWGTPTTPGATPAVVAGSTGLPHAVPHAPPAAATDAATATDVGSTPDGGGAAAEGETGRRYLCSPTVGTFYRAPEPGAAPFVEVGDTVSADQQVAIVETMKLMIPVKAELSGTIVEVLKDDGESVEHGERLFALT